MKDDLTRNETEVGRIFTLHWEQKRPMIQTNNWGRVAQDELEEIERVAYSCSFDPFLV